MKKLLVGLVITMFLGGNVFACEINLNSIDSVETLKELNDVFYEQRENCDSMDEELATISRNLRHDVTTSGRLLNDEEKLMLSRISDDRRLISEKVQALSNAALDRLKSRSISF